MKIAVYGTLKSGYGNYKHYIEPYLGEKVKFIGSGIVRKYLLGGSIIPYAKYTCNPSDYITVEVYEITDDRIMRAIDLLEGAYKKVKVNVELEDGVVDAYLYDGSHLTDEAYAHSYEELLENPPRRFEYGYEFFRRMFR